jgi:hypothetical protein
VLEYKNKILGTKREREREREKEEKRERVKNNKLT